MMQKMRLVWSSRMNLHVYRFWTLPTKLRTGTSGLSLEEEEFDDDDVDVELFAEDSWEFENTPQLLLSEDWDDLDDPLPEDELAETPVA